MLKLRCRIKAKKLELALAGLELLATRGLYSRQSITATWSPIIICQETPGLFADSTVRLLQYGLQSHAACQPGVLLVTLFWDPTNGPRLPVHVCMILAFFADSAMILVLHV